MKTFIYRCPCCGKDVEEKRDLPLTSALFGDGLNQCLDCEANQKLDCEASQKAA